MKKLWNKIWNTLRSDGQLCFGVVGILVLLFVVVAAPVLTSHDPYFYGPDSLAAPGVNGHLLGTNHMGQDVLSIGGESHYHEAESDHDANTDHSGQC